MIVAAYALLLIQAAAVQPSPVKWDDVISDNMSSPEDDGQPERPSSEIQARVGSEVTFQVVLTESESKFIFSASNCANGLKRLETGVDVPIELSATDQLERFRSATVAVESFQRACGLKTFDPFTGDFEIKLAELVARDQAYRAARAEWFAKHSDVNAKRRAR